MYIVGASSHWQACCWSCSGSLHGHVHGGGTWVWAGIRGWFMIAFGADVCTFVFVFEQAFGLSLYVGPGCTCWHLAQEVSVVS